MIVWRSGVSHARVSASRLARLALLYMVTGLRSVKAEVYVSLQLACKGNVERDLVRVTLF